MAVAVFAAIHDLGSVPDEGEAEEPITIAVFAGISVFTLGGRNGIADSAGKRRLTERGRGIAVFAGNRQPLCQWASGRWVASLSALRVRTRAYAVHPYDAAGGALRDASGIVSPRLSPRGRGSCRFCRYSRIGCRFCRNLRFARVVFSCSGAVRLAQPVSRNAI